MRLEKSTRNNAHAILSTDQWAVTIAALRKLAVETQVEETSRQAEGALRKMLAAEGVT
jgi:hypothetical protein